VVFYPARPEGGQLRVVERVQARLRFDGAGVQPEGSRPVAEPFEALLRQAVVNPQDLAASVPAQGEPVLQAEVAAGESAAIEVDRPGLTAVSYADLQAAGFPAGSADLPTLRLFRGETEVPFEVEGDGDNLLEAGERLLFYASPRFSRYSTFDVYVLAQGSGSRLALQTRPALSAGLPAGLARMEKTFEENGIYTPDCYCAPLPAGRDGDRWVWKEFNRPAVPEASLSFDLPEADTTRPARLEAWLIGYTDLAAAPDHRVDILLNGHSLGQAQWDGKNAVAAALDIPAGLLKTAGNVLLLRLPGGLPGAAVEGVWLDAFRVQFVRSGAAAGEAVEFSGEAQARLYTVRLNSAAGLRLYDITSPDRPQKLTSPGVNGNLVTLGDPPGQGARRYWLGTAAGSPRRVRLLASLPAGLQQGSHYLIIAPAAFHASLQPLIDLRQSQGLTTALVDVQAIFDAYGGRPEPAAIRDFLAQAYASWSSPPTYVLLVGDGTSDPKRYLSSSTETFIPPYLEVVDPWAGETAADNRFVTLEGQDLLPEMLIGRLPVNSPAEVQAVITKISQYETAGASEIWKGRALFVADNADNSGPFGELSEGLTHIGLARSLFPYRFYYHAGAPVERLREELYRAWVSGAALAFYTGHSSIHQWGSEIFIHINEIGALSNSGRLPVLLELTCFTGAFQVPGFRTLDEALVTQAGGGAVAAWGSTGLGVSTGHTFLAEGFLNQLAPNSPSPLGAALLAGKVNLAEAGLHLDLLDTFTLLGDPALNLNFGQVEKLDLFLPVINRQ
jgi:hypothetical protein